jgi:hypothetical protein
MIPPSLSRSSYLLLSLPASHRKIVGGNLFTCLVRYWIPVRTPAIRADQIAPLFGIKPRRNAGRTNKVAEHHRDMTTLANGFFGADTTVDVADDDRTGDTSTECCLPLAWLRRSAIAFSSLIR